VAPQARASTDTTALERLHVRQKAKGNGKRKLKRTGKARVKADVAYMPDGGAPNTKRKRVKLKRR
jgi:hypothetical protein